MNHLVTLSFALLLVALVVALDGSLALRAIDRLAESEGYTDIQSVTLTNALSGSEAIAPMRWPAVACAEIRKGEPWKEVARFVASISLSISRSSMSALKRNVDRAQLDVRFMP
jgi:hypothetical protein